MNKQMIWSGQGPIYFGTYDPVNGTPEMGYLTNIVRVGCANRSLTTTPSRETKNIKESCSGQRLDIAELETGKSLQVKLEMAQFDRDALARAFFGTSTLVAAGSVTGEAFPTMVEGGYAFLKHPNASAIVLTDSTMEGVTPAPVSLVADTHYRVIDAAQGVLQIISLDGLTQPIKSAYSHDAYGNIAAFTATNVRTGLIFTGRNQDGDKARVIIPSISMAMGGDFNWLSDEESPLAMEGPAFYVPELEGHSEFGPFMRIDGLPE